MRSTPRGKSGSLARRSRGPTPVLCAARLPNFLRLLDPRLRRVRIRLVLAQHAVRVEEARVQGDARPHDVGIGFRGTVKHGNNLVFEFVVEGSALSCGFIATDLGIVSDGPSGYAFDAAFDPPAVQDAKAGNAIEGRFHAARAGGFLRPLWSIQ